MTLLELVFSAALAGLVLALMAGAFAGAWREQRKIQSLTGLRVAARVCVDKLVGEVTATTKDGIYQAQAPDGSAVFGLLPVVGIRSNGTLVWGDTLVVYAVDPSSGHLLRRAYFQANAASLGVSWTPEAPPSLAPEALLQLARAPATGTALQAKGVAEFLVSSEWRTHSTRPMVVKLKLQAGGNHFEVERTVEIRT